MKRVLFVLTMLTLAHSSRAQTGCRYLVISADLFVPLAQQLANWKTDKGMLARVVPISQVGTTPTAIRTFVRSAWSNWNPRPEYLLIVGSPAFIPAYQSGYDTYYGDMSGDYVMELPVGRLFAGNARECSTLVFKTLNYERPTDPADTLWLLKGTTTIAEDNPADPYYQADSRVARNYWRGAGYVTAESLCSLYGNTSADVTAAANNGRAFITYRGIAGGTWWNPFHQINPFVWTNGRHTPVVIGATCYTVTLATGEEMYGDRFVRAGSASGLGGAAAYFGTTQGASSISRFRSAAYRGFFTALYEEGVYRLGDATLRARFRVDSLYHDQTRYMEWNLLGDPELNVWTRAPRHVTVMHETLTGPGAQEFPVQVQQGASPVAGAQVCVSMDSCVYAWAVTDSTGSARLSIAPDREGTLRVVLTGPNLWPYQGACRVAQTVRDVSCTRVVVPAGVLDSGTDVAPSCTVRNLGSRAETYAVSMRIGTAYTRTVTVSNQPPGTDQLVTFPDWTAGARGSYAVCCSTRLDGDTNAANNRCTTSVRVRVVDAGAVRIIAPAGIVGLGSVVIPRASVTNFGSTDEQFPVRFAISTGYADTQIVQLGAGRTDTVEFTAWTAGPAGWHTAGCSTMLRGDLDPANDAVRDSFQVSDRTGVEESRQPFTPGIDEVRPNPSAGPVLVRFSLAAAAAVCLDVGSVDGRRVRRLLSGRIEAGRHRLVWDRTDERGRVCGPGIYYCRLTAAGTARAAKLVLTE